MKLSSLFGAGGVAPDQFPDPVHDVPPNPDGTAQVAVLGGGCFWCTEAVFAPLDGVLGVRSGYAGGTAETADYRSVCNGGTDHAEVIEVRFDPARLSFGQVLKVFFAVAHDPTQKDHQGNDYGRQYRSAVFYADETQRAVAADYIVQLDAAQVLPSPVATTLEPLTAFFEAEGYHQRYAERNPAQPYVAAIALPKVRKLEKYFGEKLKK